MGANSLKTKSLLVKICDTRHYCLLLIIFMFQACTQESTPIQVENVQIHFTAKIIDGDFDFILSDLKSGQWIDGVEVRLINANTGETLYYSSPHDAGQDTFKAVSGTTYLVECTIQGETFRDSITYRVIDQDQIQIMGDFEEKNGNTLGFFRTNGLDQHPELITQYSPCLIGHPSISYPLAFSCSDYRVRDDLQNPAFVQCGLPFKSENRQLHLFYTDQRSAEFIRKKEKNASVREYDALFSSNANLYDLSENKLIVGQFYYVNSLTFNVQLEDRSSTRHIIRIIDQDSELDITQEAKDLVWSNEMAKDLKITQNEWDALRYERNFSCEKRDRLPFRKEVKFDVTLSFQGSSLSGTLILPLDSEEPELKVYVD